MFLEKRVYQGTSGKVYPMPVFNRISASKTEKLWKAVHIENEFIKVMILPELGGRIHVGQDKTNGYDFFYRQNVIKPALVGLTGPWASGGVEFNWPQHHRPATFMPVDVHVEEHPDGSKTVWLGDHDPLLRLKGMHGVCLHPGRAVIELKARAYNRTPDVQTFLWWANVGVHAHDRYQSFFPPDVTFVADHAKRAMASYPLCDGSYYGVDYAARAKDGGNDLTWYKNIPVPTSYMCMGSKEDFVGGYDHAKEAGLVHVANHHISPGKKQWTWGNHEFGYAWDRNLTDADGPYMEIMAGVYTDNQPDFSFLQPGETKSWSQYWYPIQKIGPAQQANVRAAVSLNVGGEQIRFGVSVTERFPEARITLRADGETIFEQREELAPGRAFAHALAPSRKFRPEQVELNVAAADGREIISYRPAPKRSGKKDLPAPATEPAAPEKVASSDELYVIGLHLDQYRHATRGPELYWNEALRRDPGDARCNNAMGLWHLRRGEFENARAHFARAIARLTERNPNPYDGEPYYNLGQALCFLGRHEEAYAAFYKATWNHAWQGAAFHALAELDCRRGNWTSALDHLDRALRLNADNLRARDLRAVVLRKLGRDAEAEQCLRQTLALDPLDWWARYLSGQSLDECETQTRMDIAWDCARAGLLPEALSALDGARPEPWSGTAPMLSYYRGYFHQLAGDAAAARRCFEEAARAPSDYCFPFRLPEIAILEAAMRGNPRDARAPYYLGNLFYDKKRHADAILLWEKSAKLDPAFPIVWRNLGIGYFNVSRKPAKALAAFESAVRADPGEPRLLYERDQLWKRMKKAPALRLKELEKKRELVDRRDDLAVELCALYNQVGRPEKALEVVSSRIFQPWEGGEGLALGQHVRTHLSLGRRELEQGRYEKAKALFEAALSSPRNLGEAKHLLANQSDIHYWAGRACQALGDEPGARRYWEQAASFQGDFQQMKVRAFSEMSFFTARSLERLGKKAAARKMYRDIIAYAASLLKTKAAIDYFATSLPTLLLFDDDLDQQQRTLALFLRAQGELGLGWTTAARRGFAEVLKRDPAHAAAADFLDSMARGSL